jgi:GNAT superfamily N-acetyltransferase
MEISADRGRIDREMVHRYLSEQSYWARSRTRAESDRVIDASLCFGAYEAGGRQVAHARVLTDTAAFGYLGDVFVLPEWRGRGISRLLMAAVLEHPDVRDLRRLVLVTSEAQGLYAELGFAELDDAQKWMQRRPR